MRIDWAAALAVVAMLLMTRSVAGQIFLSLPSTALHELSHWLVALVTGSRPGIPSVIPKRVDGGWQLGHVAFNAGAWSAGWVALAPLWLLGTVSVFILTQQRELAASYELFLGAAAGFGLWGAKPSAQDFLIALKYPGGTLTCCLAIFVTWSLYAV